MNKYELAVVVSAKIEDDARTEVVEKVKGLSMNGVREDLLTKFRR